KPEVSDHDEEALLELERKYCSWGDTVHYLEPPKFFGRSEGSYLYDRQGTPYLDLQMWYSAASFGYGNSRLNAALTRQLSTLPQPLRSFLRSSTFCSLPILLSLSVRQEERGLWAVLSQAVRKELRNRIQLVLGRKGWRVGVRRVLRRAHPGNRWLRHSAPRLL